MHVLIGCIIYQALGAGEGRLGANEDASSRKYVQTSPLCLVCVMCMYEYFAYAHMSLL